VTNSQGGAALLLQMGSQVDPDKLTAKWRGRGKTGGKTGHPSLLIFQEIGLLSFAYPDFRPVTWLQMSRNSAVTLCAALVLYALPFEVRSQDSDAGGFATPDSVEGTLSTRTTASTRTGPVTFGITPVIPNFIYIAIKK